MLQHSLALLLAVRCRNKEACKQLLARLYHTMEEDQAKSMLMRLIYLLTPLERDYLKSIA